MKLIPGTYYKTRDGRKAFVAAQVMDTDLWGKYCYYGDTNDALERWDENGQSVMTQIRNINGRTNDCDLIAEWSEPVKGECWVNVNYCKSRYVGDPKTGLFFAAHDTKEEANHAIKNAFMSKRIARVRLNWVEGQFDE